MVTLYHYPKCSTCRAARKWLEDRGIGHDLSDLVTAPPSLRKLEELVRKSGLPLDKFFNTSGVSYREGGFKAKLPAMTDAQKLAALAADGKLIKRPLLELERTVLVGFREAEYQRALGSLGPA